MRNESAIGNVFTRISRHVPLRRFNDPKISFIGHVPIVARGLRVVYRHESKEFLWNVFHKEIIRHIFELFSMCLLSYDFSHKFPFIHYIYLIL